MEYKIIKDITLFIPRLITGYYLPKNYKLMKENEQIREEIKSLDTKIKELGGGIKDNEEVLLKNKYILGEYKLFQ